MTPTTHSAGTPDDPEQQRIAELLRSLPAPGPMPADLSDRISEALAKEQAARPARDSRVAPLPLRSGSSPSDRSDSADADSKSGSVRTLRWLRPVAGLVAAAAVGAVAIIGVQQNSSHAPKAAVPTSVAPSDVRQGVHVESTGTNYQNHTLGAQAVALTRADGPVISSADIAKLGSAATEEGALKCAQTIGTSLLDHPDRVTVDFAKYQGTPAIIVVITKDGDSTAWVLSRSCSEGAAPLAGPTKVES